MVGFEIENIRAKSSIDIDNTTTPEEINLLRDKYVMDLDNLQ